MFMGKSEINNSIMLTNIKFKTSSSYIRKSLISLIFFFLAVLVPTVITTLKYKATVDDIMLIDFSTLIFICIIYAAFLVCLAYKKANNYFSVFPQTNTSRFLSTQMTMYLWLIVFCGISLFFYFLQLLVFKLLSISNKNIILAYHLDFELIILGIFVYLMYAFLIVTFISFIGVFIRKFNSIAIIVLLTLATIIITSEASIGKAITKPFAFLTKETSVGMFFLKSIITWILLFVISLFINKFTNYYNSQKKYKAYIVGGVGFIALMILSIIRFNMPKNDEPVIIQEKSMLINEDNVWDDDLWRDNVITIDLSEYDNLGEITVETNITEEDSMSLDFKNKISLPSDKKLLIHYRFPVHIFNNYNLIKYTNPKLDAILENNILNIIYDYDKNVKVVFISPWGIMRQFEKYRGKGVISDLPFLYSSSSRGFGYIYLEWNSKLLLR